MHVNACKMHVGNPTIFGGIAQLNGLLHSIDWNSQGAGSRGLGMTHVRLCNLTYECLKLQLASDILEVHFELPNDLGTKR